MTPQRSLVLHTPAKLNLGLEVVRQRPDGLHEIRTIFQAISIQDELHLTTRDGFAYRSDQTVPAARDIARPIIERAAARHGWGGSLELRKSIPIAAGLGGGSSDAALALRLEAAASGATPAVREAASLGADVPFFLSGGTAMARGIGDVLKPLPTPRLWFVVHVPPLAIANKTRLLYQGLSPEDWSDGITVEGLAHDLEELARDGRLRELPNAFQRQMLEHAEVGHAWETYLEVVGRAALSGAGPAIFSWHGNQKEALCARERLRRLLSGATFTCMALPAHADSREVDQFVQGMQ